MSVEFKDYYTILGVNREAGEDDIKKAFRKLARKYHPDVATDKATAEAKFKEINEAYEVLGDPDKRKKYDTMGARWADDEGGFQPPPQSGTGTPEQEFHFGGTGFSDFFEQYFSGGTRYGFPNESPGFGQTHAQSGNARPRRGSDIEGDILVTLMEAMQGTVRPVSMQTVNRSTGQVETREFQVRIPPGATDGRRIRVPGHGEPGQGGAAAGDLFLRVRHATHPDFSSREADIYHDLDIAPWEAVLGAEVVVPTLDGSIKLRIPAGAENGQKLRARNRGLPKGKNGERGDFYVVLNIQLPVTLSPEERTLWEKLRDTSTFRARPV
ncbi:curved DNA-binding protein [Prosthecobacter fusiformis]|uniref:Curved DNA-binding protein n=1 Tax=Prosthecobacter fusiformis TaxID=48464 RepID=A0A4R7SRQ0_9BACT|nr:J domain-containing protein [Prosthecobacter fusiformis]TDU81299.1 curved DNA-binding protein [Prosthecobacter fusiformis]